MKTIILDGSSIEGIDDVHDLFEGGLELPEYYGRNLDALYDCLTECSEKVTIIIRKETELKANLEEKGLALIGMLEDAAEYNENIKIRRDSGFRHRLWKRNK